MTLANRNKKHYCRSCSAEFHPTVGQVLGIAAHAQYLNHLNEAHPFQDEDEPWKNLRRHGPTYCTKHCQGKEQPDEHQHGVRLYGPGAVRLRDLVPLIMTYDQLFPEEED